MAHFDIPLDLPHAGRIADRILILVEKHSEELGVDAPDVIASAQELWSLLFKYTGEDDNPPGAVEIRERAAVIARQLVDHMVASSIRSDRLGQLVRNLFECLELGAEGAEISLRAGENPNSLQRPI
jgi:hypothetical protein